MEKNLIKFLISTNADNAKKNILRNKYFYRADTSDGSPADMWPALEISQNPGHESLQSARRWRSSC